MTDCININISYLTLLYSTKSDTQRKALLQTATPSQVRALGEICENILYGDLKIDDECRGELLKHVKKLKSIASPHNDYGRKKRKINAHSQQGGGFFSFLAPLLGTILPGLFGK